MELNRPVTIFLAMLAFAGGMVVAWAQTPESSQQAAPEMPQPAAPEAPAFTKRGADTCLRCHDESSKFPVLAIFKTKHAQPADPRSPFGKLQCETCHGSGRYYSPLYVMKDKELARAVGLVVPNEQTCKRCHDGSAPTIEPFDYAKAWARIAHGKQ